MNIGLTFPTRGRVKKTARLLLSIKDLHRHKITVCLGLDGDDPELDDYCKLTNLANELNPNLRVVPGDATGRVARVGIRNKLHLRELARRR